MERAFIAPPASRVGPITPQERQACIEGGPLYGLYDTPIDRESAFEVRQKRAGARMENAGAGPAKAPESRERAARRGLSGRRHLGSVKGALGGLFARPSPKRLSPAEKAASAALQSAAKSFGTKISREILRNSFGGCRGRSQ